MRYGKPDYPSAYNNNISCQKIIPRLRHLTFQTDENRFFLTNYDLNQLPESSMPVIYDSSRIESMPFIPLMKPSVIIYAPVIDNRLQMYFLFTNLQP